MGSGQTAAIAGARWTPRLARAAGAACVWSLGLVPVLTGRPRCVLASALGVPCPTCGATRALGLLLAGHPLASLRMHPLASPLALAVVVFALATVAASAIHGSVADVRRLAAGRAAFVAIAALYGASLVLWLARFLGFLGGPVTVF